MLHLEFNLRNFCALEIDLKHVNKNGRSSYNAHEVSEIVFSLINEANLVPSGEKSYGDEICAYFVKTGEVSKERVKLVFCICSDRPDTIGVITLYKV